MAANQSQTSKYLLLSNFRRGKLIFINKLESTPNTHLKQSDKMNISAIKSLTENNK